MGSGLLEVEFVVDVEPDQDTARHAHGQAGDIDRGVDPVSEQVADRYEQVVPGLHRQHIGYARMEHAGDD